MLRLFAEFIALFKKDNNRTVDSRAQYYKLMQNTIMPALRTKVDQYYKIKFSVGQGNKSKYPWIGIFNPEITDKATKGLYIVFLFKSDYSGVYLSLNQGITHFKENYGENKYKYARKVSKYFADMISSPLFNDDPIYLVSNHGDLGNGYENTNILSKYYDFRSYNSDVIKDLNEMIKIYDMLFDAMSGNQYQDVIDMVVSNDSEDDLVGLSDSWSLTAIKELKKSANVDEETEVISISLVDPPTHKNSIAKIERKKLKKIDYIEKTKKDMETGYLGELLVFEYEKQKLEKLGLDNFEKYLKWVSKESDSLGYDIESLGVVNGKISKIYIEVKTTTSDINTDFYISANEVETSKINNDNYFIYRVFDIGSDKPKFYKFRGSVEQNFELIPMNYKAKLR